MVSTQSHLSDAMRRSLSGFPAPCFSPGPPSPPHRFAVPYALFEHGCPGGTTGPESHMRARTGPGVPGPEGGEGGCLHLSRMSPKGCVGQVWSLPIQPIRGIGRPCRAQCPLRAHAGREGERGGEPREAEGGPAGAPGIPSPSSPRAPREVCVSVPCSAFLTRPCFPSPQCGFTASWA